MQELQRRPIKLRASVWAIGMASFLAKSGITPNQVSIASTVFAIVGGVLLVVASTQSNGAIVFLEFALAAVFIQLRLLCNLLDGLIAVENGQATKSGEIYNEIPDRISDTVLLVAAGYAASSGEIAVGLGWLAACLALMTAYVRAFGSRYLSVQDFRGPMAKQHRMFTLTMGCLISGFQFVFLGTKSVMLIALIVIALGSVYTCLRRLSLLKVEMEKL